MGFKYTGKNLGAAEHTSTWKECASKCSQNPKCQVFTHFQSSKECHVKAGFKKRGKMDGAISGKRSCTVANAAPAIGMYNLICLNEMPIYFSPWILNSEELYCDYAFLYVFANYSKC